MADVFQMDPDTFKALRAEAERRYPTDRLNSPDAVVIARARREGFMAGAYYMARQANPG